MEHKKVWLITGGIHPILINPGFFRTELLTEESTDYADAAIEDYNERRQPPLRFIAGADAIGLAENVIATLQQHVNAYRDLSGSLDF